MVQCIVASTKSGSEAKGALLLTNVHVDNEDMTKCIANKANKEEAKAGNNENKTGQSGGHSTVLSLPPSWRGT